jgi:uncharacterized SAM-dependent methyltransferase
MITGQIQCMLEHHMIAILERTASERLWSFSSSNLGNVTKKSFRCPHRIIVQMIQEVLPRTRFGLTAVAAGLQGQTAI